jgi:hypothetical protein
LLRARFDRWWIRGTLRLVMWVAVAGLAWWAFDEYWPTDERDIAADEQLAGAAVLGLSDLPDTGWRPATMPLVSPLDLAVDEEGVVSVAACEGLADSIEDGADEPRRTASFGSADGIVDVANATTVGNGSGFGRNYLEDLRAVESGACLTALWEATLPGELTVTSTTEMTASFGDETVWWRLAGSDTSRAFPIDVFVDVVVVRVGAVVSEYVFHADLEAMGVDVQRDIIQLQRARIGELLAARSAAENDDGETDGGSDSPSGTDAELGTDDGQ